MAASECTIDLNSYAELLDHMQSLLAVDGDLDAIAKECRVLLGEEGST